MQKIIQNIFSVLTKRFNASLDYYPNAYFKYISYFSKMITRFFHSFKNEFSQFNVCISTIVWRF